MGIEVVLRRRREQRRALIDRAERFLDRVPASVAVVAAAVFGSVARGDFNRWSDVDLLVVAEPLPDRLLDRLSLVADRPPRIQPVWWTPREWEARRRGRDPIAVEAVSRGVWLRGGAHVLD